MPVLSQSLQNLKKTPQSSVYSKKSTGGAERNVGSGAVPYEGQTLTLSDHHLRFPRERYAAGKFDMARKNDGLVVGVLTGLGALLLLGIASSSSRRKSRGELLAEAAQGALRRVVLALNIHEPPLILIDGGARNAWSDGHQIGINLRWIDSEISTACHSAACTMAVVVGVIAHELGHHHHGDAFSDDQHTCGLNHPRELRADRIAGWVLGKLGADQRDFARVMAKSSWSCTHPPGHERFAAIEAGYAAAVRGVPWTVL